ncbi:MAG TPA: TonB-dependent receptor [Terriglobales bacterium]|nr:TonB-dependent receptor [Terriglobales bacterium]
MRRASLLTVAVAASMMSFLAGSLSAQDLATLKVTVTDQTGAVIPGANITVTNTQTGAKRTDVTESHGLSVIPGLPPGTYEVNADAKGFGPRKIPVVLTVGQTASLNLAMGFEIKEEVKVEETVQGIDPEKAEVSQVIDTPKINDLPISGRDFIDFVLLTPTANVGRSTAVGAQSPFTETVLKLSFSGVRESHTSFFALDGADYTTSISGVQRVSPSQDWVQEFRVVDSPYTADNGRNLGSVVNTVTKSGANTTHGSVYEFFRNNKLDANNKLSAPGFNTLRFNQFGGTLGGPIRKDKNFYFLGYEGQRRGESPLYSSFILHCIDTPGCFGPGTPSINQVKESLGLQPENLGSILQIDNYDKTIVKSTNVLSENTSLNLSYLFNDSRKQNVRGAAPGEGLPSSYRDNPVRDQTLQANLFHVFNHDTASETLVQYSRRNFTLQPKGLGFEPALGIPDLMSSGGFVGSVRFYQEQHFEAAENVTYTHGAHTIKFGGELQPVWTKTQVTLFSPGFAIFAPQSFFGVGQFAPFGPGTAVAFLFLEPRSFFGQQIPNRDPNFQNGLYAGPNQQTFNDATSLDYRHTLWSLYGQDQWKVRPNLSLSFGLRYDVDQFPSAQDMKIRGKFHPTNYNNIQPRVSLAYSFNGGKSVVRSGFGLFTAPFVYSDVMVSWIGASEFSYMQNPNLPEFADPSNNLIGFGASGAVGVCQPGAIPAVPQLCIPTPPAVTAAFKNFVATGAYPAPNNLLQFPLGYAKRKFDQPLSEQASLEVEHQIGKDLYASVGYQWMHAMRLPVYSSINGTPLPGCDPLVTSGCKQQFAPVDPNFGFTLYVKPIGFSLYNAGTASLRKAFSHHFNFLANYTFSKSIDISTTVNLPNTPENYLHPEFDRAVGDNDVRNRFTLALLGESPQAWPIFARDFKVSILTSLQSGRAYTINTGFDTNGDLFPFPDRVGVSARNSYRGDPYYDTDLRVQRIIPITERLKAEASVELFNIFNRVNVEDVDHVYGAPDFIGPVPHAFGDGVTSPANPTFGTPKFVAPARQLQISFRLNF